VISLSISNERGGPARMGLPGRPGRTVYVALRVDVPAHRVVGGLADTNAPYRQRRLPVDDNRADLVLAVTEDDNNGPRDQVAAPRPGRRALRG